MCRGFGTIVLWDRENFKLFFVEPNFSGDISHGTIIKRLERAGYKLNDDRGDYYMFRNFVRTEHPVWLEEMANPFDEYRELPGWARENKQAIIDTANTLMLRVKPLVKDYRAKRVQMIKEFHEHYPDYHLKKSYWRDPKLAPMDILVEHKAKVVEAKRQFIQKLSEITGYLPAKTHKL